MRSACILKKVKKLLTENTFNKYDRYHFQIVYSVSKEETKLIYSVHGAIQIIANPLIKTIFERFFHHLLFFQFKNNLFIKNSTFVLLK